MRLPVLSFALLWPGCRSLNYPPFVPALRLSPWGTFQGMGEADPYKEFGFVVKKLTETFPKLAYLHFVRSLFSRTTALDYGLTFSAF